MGWNSGRVTSSATIQKAKRLIIIEKTLYIIAGPNGAGKTTAAYTFLPEILDCKIFLNADEIAKGISPFDVEAVAFQAGRIMLNQIEKHLDAGDTFAIETTLATRYYVQLALEAQKNGYKVVLMFLFLRDSETAVARVKRRVEGGGHHIPIEVIKRRYDKGLFNFFKYFMNVANEWYFIDNEEIPLTLAKKSEGEIAILNDIFTNLVQRYGN